MKKTVKNKERFTNLRVILLYPIHCMFQKYFQKHKLKLDFGFIDQDLYEAIASASSSVEFRLKENGERITFNGSIRSLKMT